MTLKLSSLKADLAKERDGDWVEAPGLPGVSFLVRSTNFPPFIVARERAEMKLAQKYGANPSAEDALAQREEVNRLDGLLAVEHLLLGWKGLDVDYSADIAEDLLTDEAYRALRRSVYLAANKVGRRELEFVEDAGKNFEAPSATT